LSLVFFGFIRERYLFMRSKPGIYKPLGAGDSELCHPIRQDDFERINVWVNGIPRRSTWMPIPMRIIREDEGKTLVKSDSPWLGSHALLFRTSAVDALGPMLREYGELLPVECWDADILMYNPTRVIDALDEEASSVIRFDDGGLIMIRRHVFRADVVADIDIFRIPNFRVSPTFVSHRFVDRWMASGLKGLEFNQVWAAPSP
jgi:hypothetical protein